MNDLPPGAPGPISLLDRLDLVLAALLAAAGVLFSVVEPPLPLRIAIAVPFLLFVPGYLLVLTLMPRESSISPLERLGLSLASSAALVGLAALFISLSPFLLSSPTLAAGLGLLIVLLIATADRERRAISDEAFAPFVMIQRWQSRRAATSWSPSRVFLVAALLLSLGAAGMVAVVPAPQEHFTELLARDATEVYPGPVLKMTVEVRNHEGTATTYTIESYLMDQTLDPATNRTVTLGMSLLNRSVVTVGDRHSANVSLSVPPNSTVGANRLGILLFLGETSPPGGAAEGRIRESYRNLSIGLPEGFAK